MGRVISGQTFDEERALYNLQDAEVNNCVFAGPQDGESVLKEVRGVTVNDCEFSLRYPLWQRSGSVCLAPVWMVKPGRRFGTLTMV